MTTAQVYRDDSGRRYTIDALNGRRYIEGVPANGTSSRPTVDTVGRTFRWDGDRVVYIDPPSMICGCTAGYVDLGDPATLPPVRPCEVCHPANYALWEAKPAHRPSANGPSSVPTRFRRWGINELLDADRSFAWLAKGFLVDGTYGMTAGEKKCLKTYLEGFVNIGIATGTPVLGRFEVPKAGTVGAYFGEGGRAPITNRLERIAAAMDVDLRDAPLHCYFETAPFTSELFQDTLSDDLAVHPARISIDPFYAFHGAGTNASNLFEEGALLTSLSGPCVEAGVNLSIVNHNRKTPGGDGLGRITQSGAAEWCDSWLLVSHRQDPDVENGDFHLLLDVGSRQWGGTRWDLDMNIGRFDQETGEFDGAISWDIHRHADEEPGGDDHRMRDVILDIVSDEPWHRTKTKVRELARGNRDQFDAGWDTLRDAGTIVAGRLQIIENGRKVSRDVWAPAGSSPVEGLIRGTSGPDRQNEPGPAGRAGLVPVAPTDTETAGQDTF